MEDIFIGRLMSTDVATVDPGTSVREAARRLHERRIGSLVVVGEGNQPEGIITTTDFVRLVADGASVEDATVADYMSEELVTAEVGDDIESAADRLVTYDIHHLPVVDETEGVVGMLSTTDLASYLSGIEAEPL